MTGPLAPSEAVWYSRLALSWLGLGLGFANPNPNPNPDPTPNPNPNPDPDPNQVRLRAECRTPEQSVVCTLIDHDGAVSAAAALRPLNSSGCNPSYGCGALLTHHGTGIPVRDSADAYKRKPAPADDGFVFGVDRQWQP